MKRITRHAALCGVAVAWLALTGAPAEAQSVSTAQSLSFQVTSPLDFQITGSETWAFDRSDAETYFNTTVSGPEVSCTPSNRALCGAAYQPATPATPPAKSLNPSVANSNQCTFFDGGALTVPAGQETYTQDVKIDLGNGNQKVTWKFTWTYTVAPKGAVPERTAWDLISSNYEPVDVAISGFLAGQSTVLVLNDRRQALWTFKTSHTMLDPDGYPRLADPVVGFYNGDGAPIVEGPLSYTMETGVDFYYIANAGTFGDPNQLVAKGMVNDIQGGVVPTPSGLTDNFAGNDMTGGDRAVFGETYLGTLSEPGKYSVVLSGVLKGNPGQADIGFTTTKVVTINAGDCAPAE
jgi:hypothetical protein